MQFYLSISLTFIFLVFIGIFSCTTPSNSQDFEDQVIRDRFLITTFLTENDLEAQESEFGYFYRVLQEGIDPILSSIDDTVIVSVHYEGHILYGDIFDSSVLRDEPFNFTLGMGEVIIGWDLGVYQMKVGEKTEFYFPSRFGYGLTGSGSTIPPNAVLVFEIEILKIEVQ